MHKWKNQPGVIPGLLLVFIAALVTVFYYLNYPPIEQTLDTPSYLYSMHQMQLIGNPVNDQRLPTYPLFLLLIFAITGQGNLTAVEIVQGILFVCVVGEVYVLSYYLFRKIWLAFAIGLLVGTDVIVISFVKPIMTEGLSLWLVTTMVLMVVLFLKTSHWRYFWLAVTTIGFLLFTRPEWIFFPCLLFPYLYWCKRADLSRKQFLRRLFVAMLVLYFPVICYIVANYFISGTPTLTTISYVNIFGKIVEYRMQDESPANLVLSHFIDSFVQRGIYSPWQIIGHSSQLQQKHAKAAADFAQSIIIHHPFEFFLKSAPLFFSQLSSYRPSDWVIAHGRFDTVLAPLFTVQIFLYRLNWLFPFCALAWLVLLCHPRSRSSFLVRTMALLVLLVCSIVVIQVFGEFDVAYYTRLHVEIDPLIMLIIWGTVGLLVSYSLGIWRKNWTFGRFVRTVRDFREINRPRNDILRQEKLSWRTVCMKDHLISLDVAVLQRNRFHVFLAGRLHELAGQIEKDWRSQKYTFWGSMVLVLAILVTVCSFLNYPHPITTADTGSYFVSVRQLQATGNPVHPWRLPVYPLFIVFIYAVSGQGNLMAVSIVQGALFVLTALEFYTLTALILKRGWLAFLISLFVSTNLILLSYSKPIMTEGLSLWLLTTLVLCAIYFAKTLQVRMLWLLAICMLLLCFTRPEWLCFPIFLYSYLFFLVIPRKDRRGMLLPILISLITIYALLGCYLVLNAQQYGFVGLSSVENMNLVGKILQYNMQDEAPAQYQHISRIFDTSIAQGTRSPFQILHTAPELAQNYAQPVRDFAIAIIVRHPGEFLLKSMPYTFSSLTYYYPPPQSPGTGLFYQPLTWLLSIHRVLYAGNALFPLCAVVWIFLLCWRRTRSASFVRNMGLVVLITLYELIITTLGGYFESDYARFHTVFNPLIILTIWSLLSVPLIAPLKFRTWYTHTRS